MSIIEDIYFGNLSPNEIEIEKGSEMDIQLKRIIHIQRDYSSWIAHTRVFQTSHFGHDLIV